MTHDPGGKVRLPLQPDIVRASAQFSACGHYRTELWRIWSHEAHPSFALWIGMNPSTAAEDVDDPTVRKEIGFTRRVGLSAYCKVNVMDYRATDPKKLLEWGVVPVGPDNFATISRLAQSADIVVAAWGSLHKPLRTFAKSVELMLNKHLVYCLGTTKDGSPRHPLYVRNAAQLSLWRPS
jgi:hypothetical protein